MIMIFLVASAYESDVAVPIWYVLKWDIYHTESPKCISSPNTAWRMVIADYDLLW